MIFHRRTDQSGEGEGEPCGGGNVVKEGLLLRALSLRSELSVMDSSLLCRCSGLRAELGRTLHRLRNRDKYM